MNAVLSETEFHPSTAEELADWMVGNFAGPARAVTPVGGATALHLGHPLLTQPISVGTSRLDRLVDFPARDMTVTVGAGVRIDDLQRQLAVERLQLPLDVPLPGQATLGGVLATNTSGSRRLGWGTMRDAVIGLSAVDAQGRHFKSGGRVVKNVAGYDLCKMLIGSLGTLAIVTQVTLKLRPIAPQSSLLWIPLKGVTQAEAPLGRLTSSAARPIAVDLLTDRAAAGVSAEAGLTLPTGPAVLCVGVEGGERETQWQLSRLEDELRGETTEGMMRVEGTAAQALWRALTGFQAVHAVAAFKAAVRPSAVVAFVDQATRLGWVALAHAGSGVVHGLLPDGGLDVPAEADAIRSLRQSAEHQGGSLTVVSSRARGNAGIDPFGRSTPAQNLMRTLKRQLDPRGLLSPGRLFGDL